ncbi:hypothetical protein QYE76_059766 [Lolium multiflorum]|uniref:Uncharacterized protein n=1 Tax=Lolium multiflorum TaxID=4521 RepID=A0AAD8RXK5_LOLMU|nr:hypothetical protein QYE76_059766 [Lolium multiflorum]
MLVVNTNRGGHAVFGLYIAKALLAARYAVTLMLAAENPNTVAGKIFNCVSDRAVALHGLAKMCAAAADTTTAEIVHYNPAAADLDIKKAFALLLFPPPLVPLLSTTSFARPHPPTV